MHTHEAGALHAEAGQRRRPAWLQVPDDVNALFPGLWPATVQRGEDGVLGVAGIDVRKLAEEFGTPAYVVDEVDFRSRARAFADAFATAFDGAEVYYAGKAFLCTEVARWVAEEGLSLDVCSGGELAVALRAGFPPERIALHGNNKSIAELSRALDAGVGRIVVDSFDEIARVSQLAAARGVRATVMIRVTVGVEAHTHEYIATAHEDQKFGFSLAGGTAAQAVRRILAEPSLELAGLHSHIGSQIYDTSAFEVAARRLLDLHKDIRDEHGVELAELDLGGGYGIAYTSQDDPQPPEELAAGMAAIIRHECAAHGLAMPRVSVEPGRAIAGPSTFTLYEVGTVKAVELDGGAVRRYVSVDGGMSDNVRAALYDADYSCTLASRRSDAEPVLARVVGKHCESGDIVVKDEFLPADVEPGDLVAVPGTGAYCRSLANTYNHVPRPPVLAVRDGTARVIIRRETEDDLLALDVG
ncbi:diaminopimelate decarboxylase [Actinobacteria bacterium YIM 96077]|uniref:Diaminopimelate decarboxylase n=1 Tax=Phytoactinopolyspora halophila TaxID=1981511 RepID=A0A329R2X1_9ACTN|nr:diaminopimelate decarboxylase [Phytoactinopolyspora halophila]AYY12043.1 diaminopimelate decarboxylase [Actinobacteria bacterium YIM 96077]RAW18723.1 diaminopimelate decarboxylase [Phytoactinopolyspora halophila]